MSQMPIRGVLAPAFIGLGIAAGALNLRLAHHPLGWLTMFCLVLGLAFARDSSRLLVSAFKDDDA